MGLKAIHVPGQGARKRQKGGDMFAKCSNLNCGVPFDYREGRLIRFCKSPLNSEPPIDLRCIEHFWLCGKCSELYVFECERGVGMKIKPRVREQHEMAVLSFITAA
jgi:hypothetical protein